MMAHAQKPDLVFQRNGRVHLNWRGRQFSRLLAAEVCGSAVVMLDTPCSEVEFKTTGYPFHSHVSPSLPLPCVTACHQVSTELYCTVLTEGNRSTRRITCRSATLSTTNPALTALESDRNIGFQNPANQEINLNVM